MARAAASHGSQHSNARGGLVQAGCTAVKILIRGTTALCGIEPSDAPGLRPIQSGTITAHQGRQFAEPYDGLGRPSGHELCRALDSLRLEQGDELSPGFTNTATLCASCWSSEEVPLRIHTGKAPALHASNERDQQSTRRFARVVVYQKRMVPRVQQDFECGGERLLPSR